jgi:hypothetical protein
VIVHSMQSSQLLMLAASERGGVAMSRTSLGPVLFPGCMYVLLSKGMIKNLKNLRFCKFSSRALSFVTCRCSSSSLTIKIAESELITSVVMWV